ncbi:MAG: DUF560 domain-containing protein [Desulfobacterales bacterium]|nr:DUF560 domain-containing protein [Desulfobacterales bacterium]
MKKLLSIILITIILFPVNAWDDEGSEYYNLGIAAYKDGNYQEAEMNLKLALEFDPNAPHYNHYLGKTYMKTERYQIAKTHFDKAQKVKPDTPELKYDIAFLNYKMSDFSGAASLFEEVARENPTDRLAQYYAAMCLFKEKKYKEAADYFVAAAEKNPSVRATAYYYTAICYQKTGQSEKAIEKFNYVKEHANSASLEKNAEKWLSSIQNKSKPYDIYLKISRQYDDNVRLYQSDFTNKSNEDWVTAGYFSGKYNIINKKNLQIGAGYSHYQSWHDDLSDYDLTGSIFDFYAKYHSDPLIFGFSYSPSYYWVDSESYLRRHRFKPELMWKVNSNVFTRFSYSYYEDRYFQADERSGHTNEIFADAYLSILDKKGLLFAGMGYEDISASDSNLDYDQLKFRFGASVELPWDLNLSLRGKYNNKKYDSPDPVYNIIRDDARYSGTVSLSRKLFHDWMRVVAEYDYTKNDSNINYYKYERNRATFSFTVRY